MNAHRLLADEQVLGDLAVGVATAEQAEYFLLPSGKTELGLFSGNGRGRCAVALRQGEPRQIQKIIGDSVSVWVWERDDPRDRGSWDLQGVFEVRRDLANTGEHEGYAFWDGEFIVRYTVYGG